jgi:hypothetical protein
MTVQKCIDACAADGFSSAGVEFGKECHCGNISFPAGSSAELDECNMPCLGDASQWVHFLASSRDFTEFEFADTAVDLTASSSTPLLVPTLPQPPLLVPGLRLKVDAGVTMSTVSEHSHTVQTATMI